MSKPLITVQKILCCFIVGVFISLATKSYAETGLASWYSIKSCKKEGTWQKYKGRCASGEKFDDKKMCAASWDYPFKTKVRVTNTQNGRSVVAIVCDRGPNKKLYKKGRKIDLSRKAFELLAPLSQGIITCKIEVVND